MTAADVWTPPAYVPKTAVHAIDLFVEDDCVPTARRMPSGCVTVRIGPVTLFGEPDRLARVLAEALAAVEVLRRDEAAG